MKKLFVVLGLLLIATMLFVGCKGKTDNSSTTNTQLPPQNNDRTGTIQGKIVDAVTGVALGNDATGNLKVFLIQGADDRGPSKLITDPNDPLAGEYAFSGIPTDLYTGNAKFKVVVVKAGYQRFEADVELNASVGAGLIDNTFDSVINMLKNIYLFPLGTTAGNVSVYVYNPAGFAIPNATVLLNQNANSNGLTANTSDRLGATGGLNSSLTTTTDTTGLAKFNSADLILGGNYSIIVEPIAFMGQQLAINVGASFFEGGAATTRVVTMTSFDAALFATSASNQIPGTITPGGVLSITLNQPISLSTTTFTGTLSSFTTGTVGSATGALDATGTILTITPAFTTTPTGAGASITYTYAGTITLKNTQTAGPAFNAIVNQTTGAVVSDTVQLIAR